MKLQKSIAIIAGIISILALLISFFYNYRFDDEYMTSLFTGIFSSALLVYVSSTASYFYERNKVIYKLYEGCNSFKKTLTKFMRSDTGIELDLLKDIFFIVEESYKKDIYFNVCDLYDSVMKRTKLSKLVINIWEQARHIYSFILDDEEKLNAYLLHDISLEELQKYKFHIEKSAVYINNLAKAQEDLAYYMNYYNIRKSNGGNI